MSRSAHAPLVGVLALTGGLIMALSSLAFAQVPQPASALGKPEVIEQVLVKVNGDIITKTELEGRQVAILRQRGQQLSDEELQKAITEMTPQVLVDAVDELLIVQRGRELGYKLTDERFKQIVEDIRKRNNMETDEAFQAALKAEGMTLADLRKTLENQMLRQQVEQQEIMSRISVTEDEARKYYQEHSKEFTTPAALTLREILVNVPGDGKTINVGLDEEAKAKAESAKARALGGEPFEKIAAEVSDSLSKANGGLIGPINKDELAEQFQKMLATMKVGAISDIVRTSRGYYFFKLDTQTETAVLPFEQARERIGDRVANEKSNAEFLTYLKKLREQAIIEWKNLDLKKLYDQRLGAIAAPAKPGV